MRRCYEQVRAEVAVVGVHAVRALGFSNDDATKGRGNKVYRGVVITVIEMVRREVATK